MASDRGVSIAANLPPRAKRLSLRIADLGIPIPPRISTFLDGPEVAGLEGALAWGIQDIDSDSQLKLTWASGRLPDLHDLAVEHGHAGAAHFLPIATIGRDAHMFAVDTSDPALAVYTWDADGGFKKWADDFEAFTRNLRRRGEKSPVEKLEQALEQAGESDDDEAGAKRPDDATVIELLTPAIARFPQSLTTDDEGADELGRALRRLGDAWKARDLGKARAYYERAAALGDEPAGIGLCDLLLADAAYEQLVERAGKLAADSWRGGNNYTWFHSRNHLGRGYLLTNRPRQAIRAYHQISQLAVDDPAKIRIAVADLRALRHGPRAAALRDVHATIDDILGWLDVPPAEPGAAEVAALRSWWTALPAAVREAFTSELALGAAPTDADLARVSRVTSLSVTDAGLTDASWVTRLQRLDDLDLSENDLTDLTPIAALPLLTRLDVSNNKLTSLRPLASSTRLKRLVVDENPLTGLEGLEGLHELEELHACEAGLESVEPLRGLQGLVEVTIYENAIADISPLASCPRLKEISCFTNPITSGLAALGALRWLESVDAGDASKVADVKALRAANAFVSIDQWYPDDDADGVEVAHPPDPTARAWWDGLSPVWKRALIDSELHTGKREPDDGELDNLLREDSLTIDNVPLVTLEPIAKLVRADFLCFENAGLSDLSPVSRLPRLRDLIVRDNPGIDLVSLAPAEVLEGLYIERCGVSSLIGLERCRALRVLRAEDNHVDDLRPLAELTELRLVELEGNQVSNLAPLGKLVRLATLKLGLTRVTDLAPLAGCRGLRELEVWGTPRLANALVLAELPLLTSVISHGSIPAADVAELRRRNPRLVID